MEGTFVTIPALHRTDADVALKLITKNSVMYRHVVNDPAFSAHKEHIWQNIHGENRTYYVSDFPGAALGCVMQVSFHKVLPH